MRTCPLLLAATVAAAAFATMCCGPAQAVTATPPPATTTLAATCQAAHNADRRVSATFCTTLLRDAYGPDTCYFAVAAAAEGVSNAIAARREIAAALERLDDEPEADPIYSAVLMRCEEYYGFIREKYDAARTAIAAQKYGAVKEELSTVPERGQSCDNEIPLIRRGDGGAPPFEQYNEDNRRIAVLTVAITSLIK